MSKKRVPYPQVEYQGKQYTLRSKKIVVPNLSTMSGLEATLWLANNTFARGYQRETIRIAADVREMGQ